MTLRVSIYKKYNKKQYDLIISSIEYFENGKLQIDALIANLEGLVNAIDEDDDAWKASFYEDWADLEVARAIALSEERAMLNEHETKIVFDAVGRLKKLVLEKIEAQA